MSLLRKIKKPIAAFFLLVFGLNFLYPLKAVALTSGPESPEAKGFQPVGADDLVDLFTGDFKYNIPLMDVGGYPLNLSYASGSSMDDEASWVGFGWSLNPGTINRQLRGLPDDFDGGIGSGDFIEKQIAMKPSITKGLSADFIIKRKGKPFPSKKVKLSAKVGMSYNNYIGIKAEVGFNAALSPTTASGTSMGVNLGVNSDSKNGGSLDGDVNFSLIGHNKHGSEYKVGLGTGFSYNSTKGLEGLTLSGILSGSQKVSKNFGFGLNLTGNEFVSFAGESYIPTVETPQQSKNFSFTLRAGPTAAGFSPLGGLTGMYSKQFIPDDLKIQYFPAYGLLNSHKGKNIANALMDFNRENENPYHKKIPYLPIPVINQDLFAVTSQNASGQYRVGTNTSGIFFNNTVKTKDSKLSLGLEVGIGWIFHLGVPVAVQKTNNTSGKWINRNDFKANGDFVNTAENNPALPFSGFKKVGDYSLNEPTYIQKIGNKNAVAVSLKSTWAAKNFGSGTALNKLIDEKGREYTNALQKAEQDKRTETFNYLSATEAKNFGLEKMLQSYPISQLVVKGVNDFAVTNFPREDLTTGRRANHISEITVTDPGGSRQVYGIPAYNVRQDEVSFSIHNNETARQSGLFQYLNLEDSVPTSESDPRMTAKDYNYHFSKQRMRGYAASYLLTGILSSDYVDATSDGISDDDLGNAVRFNYSKLGLYKWRTPLIKVNGTTDKVANYNEGFLTDKKDDKANYAYGEREQWYMHSIESKTMLAIFILQDRNDALGVQNSNGGVDQNFKLKSLKEIRLYSKSDLLKNRNDFSLAVPVKTVHFDYTYEIFTNVPNSLNQGKLTLKKVYFTFGNNNKGKLNPYTFNYNIPASQAYQHRQYDRWGVYKPATENRNGLNNSEFPYSTQDQTKADLYAGYWQINQINLPTGGTINITYESDDYAYVQDKRASSMCFLKGVGTLNQNTNIIDQNILFVELPKPVTTVLELKEKYFDGMEYLYFKCLTDLDNQNVNYEYITGYARIEKIELENSTTAKVTVKKIDKYNPISKAAWQLMRLSLPKLAYPEYDNLDTDEGDLVKAAKSLVAAISRVSDIVRSFDVRAKNKNFANRVDLNKSWVRLCSPEFKKFGGGSRVQKIMMNDKWSEMTGSANTETMSYGQVYEYTTEKTLLNGQKITISSGVASYEPMIGADENPFRQPVRYSINTVFGVNQYYHLELPICESYYPAPSIGYSVVKVKNIGADNSVGITGVSTSEFFTAKDYPTRIEATTLQRQHPKLSKILRLFSIKMTDHATVSQGYLVENFNMHGKQKSVRIVDKNGQEISSVSFQYRTENAGSGKNARLDNQVAVLKKDGSISTAVLGVDIDFYTDMLEHKTENIGISGEPSGGFYLLAIAPRPWFYFGGISPNYDKRLLRSAVAIKSINSFPILNKVIKTEKGSRIETENLLWDGETGDVLLTKVQNEFDDPIYSFSYPAHWVYDGMGPAYKNQGLYLNDFSTEADGRITNTTFSNLLVPGDELLDLTNAEKFWVIKGTDNVLRTINISGIVSQLQLVDVKILRSGRRNLSSTPIGTLVSLTNPVKGNKLQVSQLTQILDAKASVFSEQWSLPVKLRCATFCLPGYSQTSDGICYNSMLNPNNCGTNYFLCNKPHQDYVKYGCRIYEPGYNINGQGSASTPYNSAGSTFWNNCTTPPNTTNGRLNKCGLWKCSGSVPALQWLGKAVKITVPESKNYYVGMGGDNWIKFRVNGTTKLQLPNSNNTANPDAFNYWHIFPVWLNAGTNIIEILGRNVDGSSPANFGLEIYNNTKQEVINAINSNSSPNFLFSTKDHNNQNGNLIENDPGCKTCNPGYAFNPTDSKCYHIGTSDPYLNVFNPYNSGILGNWRTLKSFAFDITRTNIISNSNITGSTNIRKAGYYTAFGPFWEYNGTQYNQNTGNSLFSKWISPNEVTLFSAKGAEVENKDVLNRYSAAQMGYLESVPVAVASNTRLRDLAYDGFEDYYFTLQGQYDTCKAYQGHFNVQKLINNTSIALEQAYAHTGKYSLKLSTPITINRPIYGSSEVLYTRDASHHYSIVSNYLMNGFSPTSGMQYLLSFWVKDGNPSSINPLVNVAINGVTTNSFTIKSPVIEGWKKVEIVFSHNAASNFQLSITPTSGTVYVDDLRIHPYNSQMKSFAYDASTQRLLGQLDENNFATFFEYDDEGILVRIKKETEKGIMTIQENRSSVRRTQ